MAFLVVTAGVSQQRMALPVIVTLRVVVLGEGFPSLDGQWWPLPLLWLMVMLVISCSPSSYRSSGSGSTSANGAKPAPTSSGNPQALVQWGEVPQHPGLLCALTQGANNPVILLVQPETLLVHELKSLPAKSKVQGFVIVRQATPPGESVSVWLSLVKGSS